MNYPLAFPNNSTTFAPNLILSYFSTPRPLSIRLGAFSYPKHFPANFFRNFFQSAKATFFCIFGAKNYGSFQVTFFHIFGAKNYGGKRHLPLRQWGGVSFVAYSLYSNRHLLTQGTFRVLRRSTRAKRHRIRAKRAKSE